jgi:hypothetical protein
MKFRYFEVIALFLILALAAYLRLTNLADNPGWYTDEGTHLDIAQNLLCGRVQYLAINQSTLLFAKLPLFDVLLAGLLGMSGRGIDVLRTLTGVLGVVSVGMLYLVVRRAQRDGDTSLPLLAALLLAIYPQAVLYSRFGFSYNLLTPLVLLACLGLFEYLSREDSAGRTWLALAALAIGTGGVIRPVDVLAGRACGAGRLDAPLARPAVEPAADGTPVWTVRRRYARPFAASIPVRPALYALSAEPLAPSDAVKDAGAQLYRARVPGLLDGVGNRGLVPAAPGATAAAELVVVLAPGCHPGPHDGAV